MKPGVLIWPFPALLAWSSAWGVFLGATALTAPAPLALALATGFGVALAPWAPTHSRRLMVAAGFPLSLAMLWVSGLREAQALPAWAWLIALALLLLLYPLNTWADAPLFPTPIHALKGLATRAPLLPGQRVLDGGSGMGDGLRALRQQYPAASLDGVEWSWPLRWLSALRCPWARVRRSDLWATDWSPYAMVYLFQRPESMPRAADKALREMAPGAWLVSLAFPATSLKPTAVLRTSSHAVYLYRMPQRPTGK